MAWQRGLVPQREHIAVRAAVHLLGSRSADLPGASVRPGTGTRTPRSRPVHAW
ncbi:MAG TPA: hypothetical protein VH589_29625 [Trebonia sp.]|jgi:hypothetical protein